MSRSLQAAGPTVTRAELHHLGLDTVLTPRRQVLAFCAMKQPSRFPSKCAFVIASAALLWACQPPLGEPVLDLKISPKTIDDQGEAAEVVVVGTDGAGKIAAGSVTITSSAGSLSPGQAFPFDAFGKATTPFTCDVAVDDRCSGLVRVVAEWTSDGVPVIAELRVTVGNATGTGGGTGTVGAGEAVLVVGRPGGANSALGIAPLGSPTSVRIGLAGDLFKAIVKPNGTIASIKEQPLGFYEFRADAFIRSGTGAAYPSINSMFANDVVLTTPACGTTMLPSSLGDFWVRPDTSAIVYKCGLMNLNYFEGTTALPEFDNLDLVALGPSKAALMTTATATVVRSPAGVDTTSSFPLIPESAKRDARSRADGFWMYSGQMNACSLKLLKFDGTVDSVGDYAALPAGVMVNGMACNGKIDGDGSLLSLALEGSTIVVVRRPLVPGVASVVYTQASLGAPDFTRFPPYVHVTPLLLITTP